MKLFIAGSVAVALAAWLVYDFNDVYVPEGFENPGAYKTFAFVSRLITYYGKMASWLKLGNFSSSFRTVHRSMEKMVKSPEDKSFKIEESIIANVPVRIYTNLNTTTKPTALLIYYHGGAFMIGSSKAYEMFFYELSKNVDLKIISVEYRLVPEHPYPIPTEDCYQVTKYVFEHAQEFDIDVNRTILGGDSSGGNIVAVLTQRFVNEKLPFSPKLQIMIYPKLQMWTDRLPSIKKYLGRASAFMFTSLYLGFEGEHDQNIGDILASHIHTTLVDNRQLLLSYLDINNIPDIYKTGRDYYQTFVEPDHQGANTDFKASDELKEKLKSLGEPSISPLFAENATLEKLPKAYMIVLEWDVLKDEGILYSERLKRVGVDTTVAFYENAFHGIFTQSSLYSKARVIQNDLIEFLKLNV